MTNPIQKDIDQFQAMVAASIHAHWKLFFAQGVVMTGLGVIAIALPHFATVGVEIFVGWLLLIGGLFRTATVLRLRNAPGFGWSLLTAILALGLGVILLADPLKGVFTLTMALIALFAAEGIAALLISFQLRPQLPNWGWVAVGGIANLVLAYFIWSGWPATANWVIGLMFGINMVMLGMQMMIMALGGRSAGSS